MIRLLILPKPNRCLSLLLLFNLVLIAQTSLATPVQMWITPPYDLSATGHNAVEPQIALSSDGTRATAVWQIRRPVSPR